MSKIHAGSPRDAKYRGMSAYSLLCVAADYEVALDVMRSALEHARIYLSVEGCVCGGEPIRRCALCHVVSALDPATSRAVSAAEQAEPQ